jgi:uncharacterized protein YeaO (DUF488 family)
MGIDLNTFRDESQFAILPMGFCYPGRSNGGDKPPRRECAQLWLASLLEKLDQIEVTLLIGQYAQRHFLGCRRKTTLTDTVRAWAEYSPAFIPLPHPSPRNHAWFKRHAWFESDVLPMLRERIDSIIACRTEKRGPVLELLPPAHDNATCEPQRRRIFLRRAYDDRELGAYRVLVDRVWPRGLNKTMLKLDRWARDLAPSTELRKWFGHDPARWTEFQQRYRAELEDHGIQERIRELLSDSRGEAITLIYGARDEQHNHAIVLRDVLLQMSKE